MLLAPTLAYWVLLISETQLSKIMRGFFWHSMHNYKIELGSFWLIIPMAILAVFTVMFILRSRRSFWWSLFLLFVLGYAMQLGFGLMEGRGMRGLSDRMVTSGHSEFAKLSAMEGDIARVATNYEKLLESSRSMKYIHTKPPGQLLFYMLTQKASNIISPVSGTTEKYDRLKSFAAFVFPLISYIVLIPLFFFARMISDERTALQSCLVFVFVPTILLATLHLDQVLYPLFSVSAILEIANGCRRNCLLNSIIAGLLLYLGLFVSFSLLPVLPLAVIATVVFCLLSDQTGDKKLLCLKVILGITAGITAMYIIGRLFLDYDPLVRFQNAMLFHQEWKRWTGGVGKTVLYALFNFIEFICWVGIPVMIVYFSNIFVSGRAVVQRKYSIPALMSLSVLLVVIVTGLFGKTKGEVARIWIFFVPFICIFAAIEISRKFQSLSGYMLSIIIFLQLFTTILIKKYQDFY